MSEAERESLVHEVTNAMRLYDRLKNYTVKLEQGSEVLDLSKNVGLQLLDRKGALVRSLWVVSTRCVRDLILPALDAAPRISQQVFVRPNCDLVVVAKINGATIAESLDRCIGIL